MDDITGLEAELRSNGISVEDVVATEQVDVTYLTAFPAETIERGEIGRVCNTFIDLLREGRWDPTTVTATSIRAPGDVQARWHADADWFRDLVDGELSEVEFSSRVLETITYPDTDEGEQPTTDHQSHVENQSGLEDQPATDAQSRTESDGGPP